MLLRKYQKGENTMSKNSEHFVVISNYISAALLAVAAVFQFLPFWQYDGTATSISSYLWFPQSKTGLSAYLQSRVGSDFMVDDIVLPMVGLIVLALVGIFFCLWKAESPVVSLFPLACGGCGLWGYLAKSARQLGNHWKIHAVVCGILAVIGFCAVMVGWIQHRNEKRALRQLRGFARV